MTSSREIQVGNAIGLWEEYDDWSCDEGYNCHIGEVYMRNPTAKTAGAVIGGGAGVVTGGGLGSGPSLGTKLAT